MIVNIVGSGSISSSDDMHKRNEIMTVESQESKRSKGRLNSKGREIDLESIDNNDHVRTSPGSQKTKGMHMPVKA